MGKYNVTVVIPCLNPDEKLLKTVTEIEEHGFDDIIIINDGSSDEYTSNFPDTDVHTSCTLLTHEVNKGKGAALKTAFKYIIENRTDKDGVITIDADGQHLISDIIACCEKMALEDQIVLGCRDFSGPHVPPRSRFGNRITRGVFRVLCGLKISDTQTGLRAIPIRYLCDFLAVKGDRYEYETNMLLEFKKQNISFSEVSISTVYINDNETSHFRPIIDSIRIYRLVLAFCFSSIISMLVEMLLFYLGIKFIFGGSEHSILFATILARVCSAIVNFTINRNGVFSSRSNVLVSALKYIALAVTLIFVSSYAVKGLVLLLNVGSEFLTTLIKALIDTLLFLISFRVQQNWVFTDKGKK